jgi:hypothetical protein
MYCVLLLHAISKPTMTQWGLGARKYWHVNIEITGFQTFCWLKENMFLLVHRRKEVMQYEYNPTLTQKLQLKPELHVARYHSYLSARDAEPWHTFLMYFSLVYIPHFILYWPIHTIYVATTLLSVCPISLANVNVLVVLLNTSSHKIGIDSSPANLWCYFCIGLEIH